MLDTIEEYRIILSIYRSLSLTASSVEFGTSPASMSKKLSAIEAKIGKRLFNRSTREFSPTEDGELYFIHATELLDKIDLFNHQDIKQTEPAGVIKLSASTSFARLFLMSVIKQFLEAYPKVKIDLILSDEFSDIVKEGIDLAIRIAPLRDSGLISKKIGSGRKVLCASKNYVKKYGVPKTPLDLKNHNCLILGTNNTWTFIKGRKEYVVKVKGSLRLNYGEMLVQGVLSGLGISYLSLWHVHKEIKNGELISLLDGFDIKNQPDIFLIYPERKQLPLKTRTFIDFLESHFRLPNI